MASQPVIPTPFAQRWRDFRIQYVPWIMFVVLACAAAVIWKTYIFPASLVGRIESIQANLASPKAGWITQLNVVRFQRVTVGEPLAEVTLTVPEVMTNSLALIRAEIEEMRIGMAPVINAQRISISYDQLRLNWLQQRVDLATSNVSLQLAASEYLRIDQLFQNKLVSDSEHDIARSKKEAMQAEVDEQTRLVAALEKTVQRLGVTEASLQDPERQLRAAIAVLEERLKLTEAEQKPLILRAPISGRISLIHRWNGETVALGDPIVTITTEQTERIVGYLRQPFYIQPKTNMTVQVRTRSFNRLTGLGKILAVGSQLQPITDALLPPTRYDIGEEGLPILVSVPEELRAAPGQEAKVHPGEFVDLTILLNK